MDESDASFVPPPLFEGTLDEAGLDTLIGDLGAVADVTQIRLKSRAAAMSTAPTDHDLGDAVARLRQGEVRALQVLYAYGGAHWSDTILCTAPGSYRVVRLRVP